MRGWGRSQRVTRPPTKYQDYHCSQVQHQSSSTFSGTKYLLKNYLSFHRFPSRHCAFLGALTSLAEPKTFTQAVRIPE